jgi:hypothetical protein
MRASPLVLAQANGGGLHQRNPESDCAPARAQIREAFVGNGERDLDAVKHWALRDIEHRAPARDPRSAKNPSATNSARDRPNRSASPILLKTRDAP